MCTDQIIPARFLKATTREEKFFGDNLFRDWRYNADGSLNKDFVLNNPTYSGQVLVAGKNFGSGSSREHAAWAIAGYGFGGCYRGVSAGVVRFDRSGPEDGSGSEPSRTDHHQQGDR